MTIDITPEAVADLWEDYLTASRPDNSDNAGGTEFYDIEGMNDAAHSIYEALRTMSAVLADYQKGQAYRYIGKDGIPILARDLEDQRDAALAALERSQAETMALFGTHCQPLTPDDYAYLIAHLSYDLEPVGNPPSWNQLAMETIRLYNAITASKAETAAAYAIATHTLDKWATNLRDMNFPDTAPVVEQCSAMIRALTPASSKAALDRMLADARADALSGPWEDKPDALTAAVEAAHPHYTKDYKTYTEALELVSARHSKGALVGLVNYLLASQKGQDHE